MNNSVNRYDLYVVVLPGQPDTLPPKDGLVSAVTLVGSIRTNIIFIFWDAAWGGGRGGWFTVDNKAVAEKSILMWEKRVVDAPNYFVVSGLNKTIQLNQK